MNRWLCGLLVPALASAGPSKHASTPSPCGVKVLPLAVGNRWTYAYVPPRSADRSKPTPAAANSIVITVKGIDATQGGDTVITLEENTTIDLTKDLMKPVLDERSIETTITCNANKLEIAPDSFLFAGEPGGFVGLQLGSVARVKGTTWQLTGGTFGQAWHEDITATWTREVAEGSEAKLGTGTIELERTFTPHRRESIKTKLGEYTAIKLELVTTGRIALVSVPAPRINSVPAPRIDHAAKPTELPAGVAATLWIADGVGLVQATDSFAHTYQLTAVTLK